MNKVVNYFKLQAKRQHPAFIILLLFLSFLGTNIYYYITFDNVGKLQESGSFFRPNTPQNVFNTTNWIDLSKKLFEESRTEIEVNDPFIICEFWHERAERNNSWTNRIKANELCVNAILQRLGEIDKSKQIK